MSFFAALNRALKPITAPRRHLRTCSKLKMTYLQTLTLGFSKPSFTLSKLHHKFSWEATKLSLGTSRCKHQGFHFQTSICAKDILKPSASLEIETIATCTLKLYSRIFPLLIIKVDIPYLKLSFDSECTCWVSILDWTWLQ